MSKRFTSEVILEALCYAVHQTFTSHAEITQSLETEEGFELQVAELVEAIEDCRVNLGVDDVMMEDIYWFTAIRKYLPKK